MLKKFLSGKKTGFYLSALGFLFALLTLIVYTARGGNYLSPVSAAAVVLLVIGLITNILCLFNWQTESICQCRLRCRRKQF